MTNASGASSSGSQLDFEPYGAPLVAPSSLTSYHFTGQSRDLDLSLQYHRARWYSADRANWVSADHVTDFPQSFANAYGYVGCSPMSRRDGMGLFSLGELNVSSAIQGILTQVVLPNVVSAMLRTIFAAVGVDLSFIIGPIVSLVAKALQLDALMDRLAVLWESNAPLIDKLLEIVRIVTIVGFCIQTAQTVFSIVRFFTQRGLATVIDGIAQIWGFVVALQSLSQEFGVSYNATRYGRITFTLPPRWEVHHILTNKGIQADRIMALLSKYGLGHFDLNDPKNLLPLFGHRGGHTKKYRAWAYNTLLERLEIASPGEEESALYSALEWMANEIKKDPRKP